MEFDRKEVGETEDSSLLVTRSLIVNAVIFDATVRLSMAVRVSI